MDQKVISSAGAQHNHLPKPNRDLSFQVAHNLWLSFRFAWTGLYYTFLTQRNFRIHVSIGIVAIGLGLVLHLSRLEMTVVALTIGMVLAMELLNTALEAVVDLTVKQTYHDLAKIAKDCAAGAVLITSLAAIAVAGLLLLPPLWELIQTVLASH
jgi:diacylglycerol kinase (ATP)